MRVVAEPYLKQAAVQYPQAGEWLESFRIICRKSKWKNIVDLRRAYPHADLVEVKSKRKVIVLNVAGNKYRLMIAAHFTRQIIYTLRFMTHAEYSKEAWKNEL